MKQIRVILWREKQEGEESGPEETESQSEEEEEMASLFGDARTLDQTQAQPATSDDFVADFLDDDGSEAQAAVPTDFAEHDPLLEDLDLSAAREPDCPEDEDTPLAKKMKK